MTPVLCDNRAEGSPRRSSESFSSGFRADLDTGDLDVRLAVSMRSRRGPEPVLSKVEGMRFW
jgi:hypothetical protein